MAQKIDVALPEDIVIGDGWQVVWDAVDPTTGASVSGVTVTNTNVTSPGTGESVVEFELGPYMLTLGPGG